MYGRLVVRIPTRHKRADITKGMGVLYRFCRSVRLVAEIPKKRKKASMLYGIMCPKGVRKMSNDQSDVCPICHNHSLFVNCSLGEWSIGCDECGIETDICDSYEEAEEEWEKMMSQRISFVTKVDS